MPIHRMSFDDGVFFAKQVGYVDHVDVRMWANALRHRAQNNDMPIMAVIDILDADRLCPTMITTFQVALEAANVLGIALVAGDPMTPRDSQILGQLKTSRHVRVFSSLDKAMNFARSRLHPSIAPCSNQNLMRFAASGIF